jgi:tyrosine-specific transport protein
MESSIVLSKENFSWPKFFSGTLMVAGTTVGAGMLGIPLLTAKAGFWPALSITICVWAFMVVTGLLLLEVTLKMPQGANLLSLSGRYLGSKGKWLAGALFLFLYYSLLVAYFAGGAPLLGQFFSVLFGVEVSETLRVILFTALFGSIVALGARWIDRANIVLTLFMLVTYFFLVWIGSSAVKVERFAFSEFSFSLLAVPVLFSAFGYHNIVPSLTSYLGKEKKTLRLSILCGTFLAFVIYAIWQWLILGALPQNALEEVLKKGLPVTYALQAAAGSSFLYLFGQLFAFAALTTSLLGVSFSLVDFLGDGLRQKGWDIKRRTCVFLAFVPPFLFVLFDPSIFDRALGVAGGFGEAILNGLIPVLLFSQMMKDSAEYVRKKTIRAGLFFLSMLCLFVVLIECKQFIISLLY